MKHPQKLPLNHIFDLLPPDVQRNSEMVSLHHGIGVAVGIGGILFSSLKSMDSPFLLEDYRLGMVARGWFRVVINLRECLIRQGTIVFVTPGTIVQPLEVSPDFQLEGMGATAEKFELAHDGKLPLLFNGQMMDGRRSLDADEQVLVDRMLRLLRDLMQPTPKDDTVILHQLATFTHLFDHLFRDALPVETPTHSHEVFNRFLRLVNLYGPREHQLAFYADRLCITPRYLGTVVQDTSGVKAKEWIDRAIVTKAKVLLRHSDKQISQVADELHFANVSFFCKYFKRLTGMTPQRYRQQ